MHKFISIVFVFLFAANYSIAQELPPIINYATNDYLAGNQNWNIAQGDKNIIYVANNNGLLQYNGAQWKLYPTPNGSIVRSVKCVANRVYTGFYMDFGYWEPDAKGILNYTSIVKESGLNVQEDEQFWEIFVEDGYVLFQSLNGVYSYDLKSKKLKSIVKDAQITKLFKVGERFFFQDLNYGLYEIKSGKAQRIAQSLFFQEKLIIKMFKVQSEILFITNDNEIYKFVDDNQVLVATNQFKEGTRVYSALLLKDGSLMVGTISHGVVNLALNGKVNYYIDASTGLANNTALSIFEDADSNLWIGLDNGLSCLNAESPFKTFIDRNGKLGTVYASLYDDGLLYLGTNQGLFVKSRNEQEFSIIKSTQGQVWSLKKIGNTIFCGHNDGTFAVKGRNATYISKMMGVWDLQALPGRDDLIIQGSYSGLHILERKNDAWLVRNKLKGFDISSKDLAVDGSTIYVSHEYKGVFKIQTEADYTSIKKVSLIKELGKGITSDLLKNAGDIVYANHDGIFIKKQGTADFKRNELLSGVYTDGYTSSTLINDQEGGFWIFTENHLNKVSKQPINDEYSLESIPLAKYVRNEKRGYENLSFFEGNKYLLGSAYGYMIVDVKNKRRSSHEVFINQISHNSDGKEILHELSKPVSLSHETNNLNIFFNTPVYEGFHTVFYRYRLIRNTPWSPWSTSTVVNFKNLDYDTYDFEVQSMVNSIVSTNTDTLKIDIDKPFYLSNLAIVLYVLMSFLLLAGINKANTLYYKKQREDAYDKQQRELELQNLENEKDLINLRNEKLKMDIEARNRELAVSAMSMIKKNETLSEIKVELEKSQNTTQLKSVKKLVDDNLSNKEDWVTFEKAFNNADKDFFKKIKELHPSLTSGDLRLCVYLRLNLSSKEIAPLLNISPRSVEIKRYRLRKKLGLSRDDSLTSYIVEV